MGKSIFDTMGEYADNEGKIPVYEPEIVGKVEYYPPPQPKRRGKLWVHLLLFVATVITTTFAGALMTATEAELTWRVILGGLRFSVPLLFILGVHEMGHYLASRRHGIDATLPYFIPAPTFIGTFGAFIKIKSPIYDRRALMDVGAAGPLAGFFAAIPVLIWGIARSPVGAVVSEGGLHLGNSIILSVLVRLIKGPIPEGHDIFLSPAAFAGWIGLFVTAMNLLPVGQLDGGHIAYALWGKRANLLSRLVFFALLPLGFLWTGWLVWAVLLLFIVKLEHPPVMDPYQQLDPWRKFVGYFCLFVFVITFIPAPFSMG